MPQGAEVLDWIGALPPELRAAVLAETKPLSLPAGAFLYQRGEPAKGVFRIEKGRVRLFFLTPGGRELVLKVFFSPESVGEIAAVDGRKHELFAEAHTDCELQFLPFDNLKSLRKKYPAIDSELLYVMTRVARNALNFTEEIAVFTLEARVASRLAWLAASAEARGDSVDRLKIPQKELGLMVGASRQAINKALSDLQKQGVLKTSYGAVTIVDVVALRRLGTQADKVTSSK